MPGMPFEKNPIAMIFIVASIVKMIVKTMSKYDIASPNLLFGSCSGLLNISVIEFTMTINKIKFSNHFEIVIFVLVVIILPLMILIKFKW